ncbi:NACHT domain-containing protein [Streptomyces syringium]|uniref:NACHT domain-containing protein n=1 Tax=Streptomyces syringium TaxID=76729 RepID=UPI003421F086
MLRTRSLVQRRRRIVRNGLLAGLTALCGAVGYHAVTGSGLNPVDVCALFITIAALAVGIADFFRPQDAPSDPGALADDLAGTVDEQWSDEAGARSLRDPRVLPLSWSAGRRAVADAPDRVTGPAAGGQILRLRLDGRLDGRFDEATAQLAQGYGRVCSGRLVVLGEPGAGKTVLAILLALGLMKTRTPGGPVPVLLAASSWDPVCEPLDDLIVHTLASSYYSGRRDIPRRLLDRGLLLPILDGLDEIPESSRRSAIHAINRALGGDRPIVVTCRSAEYEDVIEGGAPVLRRAPVVQVAPVAVDDVIAYLEDIDWPEGTDWRPVFAHLRAPGNAGSPVTTALSTPLMVSLTRLVHQRGGGDPADLLDARRFDCRHAVEDHILGRVIDAAYAPERLPSGRPVEGGAPRWDAAGARGWLTFLAQYLHQYRERDLAWWLMSQRLLSPWVAPGIGIGTGAVLIVAILAWMSAAGESRPADALLVGAAVGSGFALVAMVIWYATTGRSPGQLSLSLRGSLGRLRLGFTTGLLVATIPCLPFIAGSFVYTSLSGDWYLEDDRYFAVLVAVCLALSTVIGLAMAVHNWLDAPPTRSTRASPLAFIRQDRRSALAGAVAAGLVVSATLLLALIVGAATACFGVQFLTRRVHWDWPGGPTFSGLTVASRDYIVSKLSHAAAVRFGQVFVLPAVVTTLLILLSRAWTRFLIARTLLAVRGDLPWQLLAFLSDARDRGILRQSGGAYQFRHIRLQEQLARHATPVVAEAAGGRAGGTGITRRRVLAGAAATAAVSVAGGAAMAVPEDRSLALLDHLAPPSYRGRSVAFSHDGRTVAVHTTGRTLGLYDWRTARRTATVRDGSGAYVQGVTFGADDRQVFVTYEGNRPDRLGTSLHQAQARGARTARFAALGSGTISADGRVLSAVESGRSFSLWDTGADRRSAGPRIGAAETGTGTFVTWALSPDGRYLATAATDGTVSLWDREAGETVGHTRISAPVVAIEAGRTGTVVAIEIVEEGTDTTTHTCHVLRQGAHLVRKIELPYGWELSGDGKTLAAAGDEAIDVLDTATGELLARLPASVGLLALNRDGGMIATAGDGDTVELWDTRGGGHRTATLVGHLGSVASAAFSDDGRYLATHSEDGTVRVWNAREGVA